MSAARDIDGDPRGEAIRVLGDLAARLRAAGDVHGAQLAADTLARLVGAAPAAAASPRAEVIDLAALRDRRGR